MSSPDSSYNISNSFTNSRYGRRSSVGSTDEQSQQSLSIRRTSSIKKRHVCSTCQKSFSTSGHLSRHQRTHTGERAFACPWPGCSTRCSRQDNLQQHYRTHLSPRSRKTDLSSAKAMRAGIKSVTDIPGEMLAKGKSKNTTSGRKSSLTKTIPNEESKDTNSEYQSNTTSNIPFNPCYLPNPQLPIPSTSTHTLPPPINQKTPLNPTLNPVPINSNSDSPFTISPSSTTDHYPVIQPIPAIIAPSPDNKGTYTSQSVSPTTSPFEQTKNNNLHSYHPVDNECNQNNAYDVRLKPKVSTLPTSSSAPLPLIGSTFTTNERFLNHSTSLPSLNLQLDHSHSPSTSMTYGVPPPTRMYSISSPHTTTSTPTLIRPTPIAFAQPTTGDEFEYPSYSQDQVTNENYYNMATSNEQSTIEYPQQWNTQYY